MPTAIQVPGGARDLALGLQGAYFTASNPTPGTGIAGHAAPTTFDATKPLLFVRNESSDKLLVPMYLRVTLTAASVGNSLQRFTQVIDTATATRYASGGTRLANVNTSMTSTGAANGSNAAVWFGAVVAGAAGAAARTVSTQTYRTVLGVVGDVYQMSWGAHEACDPASLITSGTAISNVAFGFAPVVLAPNAMFLVHQWAASQSAAPSFEVEFGWAELPIGG